MAILEKIRKRTFFLILTIGLALFAFVVSGLFDKNMGQMPTSIGKVNGEEIPMNTFRTQVENTLNNMGRNQNIGTMYVVNMLWQQAVQGKILDQQFEKLGITIGKDQIFAALAQSPAIAQDPQFQNANGIFDPNKFAQFVANLKTSNPEGFRQWQMQEDQLAESAKRQMYLSLVRAGLGATASEGEAYYHQEADKVDIKYVTIPYTSIADSVIKISDKEIQNYIDEHKKEYKQENGRNIQFVYIKEEASDTDKQEIKDMINRVNTPQIRYNSSTQANDTIVGFALVSKEDIADFVNTNSDIAFDSLYISKEKLSGAFADPLYNLNINEIYGPYEDNGYYKLSRMLGKISNAEVRASHILISFKEAPNASALSKEVTRTKEEARAKAENILAEARKSGADFEQLARDNSDDTSTANGDLNFFSRGQMVKPFNDYVFSNKVGDIGLVETDFGFHIIKITDSKEGVQLATIARQIEPSEKTRNDIFVKVSNFESKAFENPTKFGEIAQKESLLVLPADNLGEMSEDIIGLGNNRSIVQWAFKKDTKVGDIERFNVKDGYVVAQLTKKIEKGTASVADARALVTPILIKQEKAKRLMAQLKGNTIDQIASSAKQENIRLAEGLTQKSPMILGVGLEPKVVGTAFALSANKLSKPIEGENGVYVIVVTKKEIAPALPNYGSYTNTLRTMKMNRATTDLFSALEESAKIEDYRNLAY
ncbi:peptidylprolyl isomerase [Capnocytophaga catalasegens]|uniref:Periplasmic chaperone PpiD n=1 Tax=Capnocytophaga catalasegens TaxID=1004260 RepID=A0AAV5AQQ4_9FLAO|nr:peptidylprolyl isomerase [Capnocytophaga catalasegens]GIZ14274.1 peptidylprolyl isomerase [Capnocytophaga catalasegens]GJM49617.1 peptidylprolyl isomerase [Capnocytophaga catalasegens]GJM52900.1 peptidylprolyl isomerase [Capnocytophaga catalasegens]